MSISVSLCTYNGASFLPDQLESIRRQTRLPDELVVCDDCSKDDTLDILRAFAGNASFPVHIHQNERTLGSTRNFEKAIGRCSGETIALCDQDDVWKPQKLERLADVLLAHPDAGYVFSDAELVDEQLQPLGRRLWDSIGFFGEIRERFERGEQVRCFARQHIVTGATMAFRAPIGKLAMPFPTHGTWIHDGWIALVSSAVGAYGVAIDEPLVAYRQHSSQQIGVPDSIMTGAEKKSLWGMYQELKRNQQLLFAGWEKNCLRSLQLKATLEGIRERSPSAALERNLAYFEDFETHYHNRKKILMSSRPERFMLILREALSGRYGRFSNSWRSLFRDLFL